MTPFEADLLAKQLWGPKAAARVVPHRTFLGSPMSRYLVGLRMFDKGRIVTQYGTSMLSFEKAFENAAEFGHIAMEEVPSE